MGVGLHKRILHRLVRIGRVTQVVVRNPGGTALMPLDELGIPLTGHVQPSGSLRRFDVYRGSRVGFAGGISGDDQMLLKGNTSPAYRRLHTILNPLWTRASAGEAGARVIVAKDGPDRVATACPGHGAPLAEANPVAKPGP